MEWLLLIVIVVIVLAFFLWGGEISIALSNLLSGLAEKPVDEKDYVLRDTPSKGDSTEPEDTYLDDERETLARTVRQTIVNSVAEMTGHGAEVGVEFVQPYSTESLVSQALRYEALAKSSYAYSTISPEILREQRRAGLMR